MLVIEDLEASEAALITEFLHNAVYNDDLPLNISDCIFTAKEIKFHEFKHPVKPKVHHDSVVPYLLQCMICGKDRHDTRHQLKVVE